MISLIVYDNTQLFPCVLYMSYFEIHKEAKKLMMAQH